MHHFFRNADFVFLPSRLLFKEPEVHHFEDDIIRADKKETAKKGVQQKTRKGLDALKAKIPLPKSSRKDQLKSRFADFFKEGKLGRGVKVVEKAKTPEPVAETEIPEPVQLDAEVPVQSEAPVRASAAPEAQKPAAQPEETAEVSYEMRIQDLANDLKNAVVQMKRRKIGGSQGGAMELSEVQYHYTYNLDKSILDDAGISSDILQYAVEKFDVEVHRLGAFAETDDLNRVFGILLAIRQLGTRADVNLFFDKVKKAADFYERSHNKKAARRQLLSALNTPLKIETPNE